MQKGGENKMDLAFHQIHDADIGNIIHGLNDWYEKNRTKHIWQIQIIHDLVPSEMWTGIVTYEQ
jgi:hypothetical protein